MRAPPFKSLPLRLSQGGLPQMQAPARQEEKRRLLPVVRLRVCRD